MKKSTVKFSASALKKQLMTNSVELFTNTLISYARDIIDQIGKAISSYHSANHMDRTGNLLNSLCWCVSYRGEIKGYGFYREANSLRYSHLHEWSKDADWGIAEPVWGHALAKDYIDQYGKIFTEGWRIFFAVLAPYWGYWEDGFTMRTGYHKNTSIFKKFSVMTWFYDTITRDLKPTRTTFKVHVPTYSASWGTEKAWVKGSLEKRYRAYSNEKSDPYAKYKRHKHGKGKYPT